MFKKLVCGGLFVLLLSACGRQATEQVAPAANESATDNAPAEIARTASAEGASVFFVSPADGATVSNPVSIEFGIDGMGVVKAGDNTPHTGHHHLLIDTGVPDPGLPIPADINHVHFGDGSTRAEIELSPGQHSLQMLLGDHLHIPHDPALVSATITITVK